MAKNKKMNLPINEMDEQVLMLIPGIGEKIAERILSARDEFPFLSASDMADRVSGISEAFASEWFAFPAEQDEDSFEDLDFEDFLEEEESEVPAAKRTAKRDRTIFYVVGSFLLIVIILAVGMIIGGNLVQDAYAQKEQKPVVAPTQKVEEPVVATKQDQEEIDAEETSSDGDLFQSPVEVQDFINEDSSWLIAEPGVLLDNTATFDRGNSAGEHFSQCPEGGFFYASLGEGTVSVDDMSIQMVSGEGINNLVLVRCRIDDGMQDTDLNLLVKTTGYTPGNIITSPMPAGAYVSANWFAQQLNMSAGNEDQSGGNCGASGCSKTYIHLLDVDSGFYQQFLMEKPDINSWELMN